MTWCREYVLVDVSQRTIFIAIPNKFPRTSKEEPETQNPEYRNIKCHPKPNEKT